MLKNAYFLAKIGADTAENEQHFAEMLPIGRRVALFLQIVSGVSLVFGITDSPGRAAVLRRRVCWREGQVAESGRRPSGAAS